MTLVSRAFNRCATPYLYYDYWNSETPGEKPFWPYVRTLAIKPQLAKYIKHVDLRPPHKIGRFSIPPQDRQLYHDTVTSFARRVLLDVGDLEVRQTGNGVLSRSWERAEIIFMLSLARKIEMLCLFHPMLSKRPYQYVKRDWRSLWLPLLSSCSHSFDHLTSIATPQGTFYIDLSLPHAQREVDSHQWFFTSANLPKVELRLAHSENRDFTWPCKPRSSGLRKLSLDLFYAMPSSLIKNMLLSIQELSSMRLSLQETSQGATSIKQDFISILRSTQGQFLRKLYIKSKEQYPQLFHGALLGFESLTRLRLEASAIFPDCSENEHEGVPVFSKWLPKTLLYFTMDALEGPRRGKRLLHHFIDFAAEAPEFPKLSRLEIQWAYPPAYGPNGYAGPLQSMVNTEFWEPYRVLEDDMMIAGFDVDWEFDSNEYGVDVTYFNATRFTE